MKRLVVAILSVLLMLQVFVGCGGRKPESELGGASEHLPDTSATTRRDS